MITLAQLRCFLAVVDEMNFRRAAARLNMTQPPLTRQIQALEHQVGAPLFDRSSRHIRLTAAGEHFVRSARRIMAQSLDAVRDARRIAGGDSGALTIAFTAASSYVFLPRMVALLRAQMPEVSLTLREMTSPQQWAALRDEQIDIGLSRPPMIQAGIDSQRVYRERLCAVLPVGHALAEAGAIALEALAGETLITYPPVEALYLHSLINGWLHVRGVTFADVQHVTQTHSILALVAAGLGVGIVPQSVERFMPAEVVLKPIVGAEEVSVDLILAWRRTTDNAACQPAARLIIETLVGP